MDILNFLQDVSFQVFDFVLRIISPEIANITRILEGKQPIPIHYKRMLILAAMILLGMVNYQIKKGNNPIKMTRGWIAQNAGDIVGSLLVLVMIGAFQLLMFCTGFIKKASLMIIGIAYLGLIINLICIVAIINTNRHIISAITNKPLFNSQNKRRPSLT